MCHRVSLVASCCQQSIVETEMFEPNMKLTEQCQGTYRCVIKRKEWHLLLERLEFNLTPAHVNSLPTPPDILSDTALRIGRIVINECHEVGSRVCVIDCQIHRIDKMEVNCIIKDLNSGLQTAVVLLVISGTYLLSNDSEQLPKGTVVIMSLDEFEGENFLSANPNCQAGIMHYFDPTLVIEKQFLNS